MTASLALHHQYQTSGPGGAYRVTLGWEKAGRNNHRWAVVLEQRVETPRRRWWRPWARPLVEHRTLRRHEQLRRLVIARGIYEQVIAEANALAGANPPDVISVTIVEQGDSSNVDPATSSSAR